MYCLHTPNSMSSGFSKNQMITLFERIACVTPPKRFYLQDAFPEVQFKAGSYIRKMKQMVVDCLKTQKIIVFQSQIKQFVDENPKVAECHVFKAEMELALMKPDIALQTINDALRCKAEPQELLRDVHLIISSYLNKAKKTNHKPVIVRKPKNDPYSRIYQPDEARMEEIELLLAYLLGGPVVFDIEGELAKAQQQTQPPTQKVKATQPAKQTKPQQQPKQVQIQIEQQQPKQTQQQQVQQNQSMPDAYDIAQQLLQKKQEHMQQLQQSQQITQERPNQPSSQLLEYMRKKNMMKRSYVPPEQQQQQQHTEEFNQQAADIVAAYQAAADAPQVDVAQNNDFVQPQVEEFEALPVDQAAACDVPVVPVGDADFDESSGHGFQEEMMQSLGRIRAGELDTNTENVFDIDGDAAFYIKK